MDCAYYDASVSGFLRADEEQILGRLASAHPFDLSPLQTRAWLGQVRIGKDQFQDFEEAHLAFEYLIPRMGKRADAILLHAGIVFVLEFKVGSESFSNPDADQVLDYALDLKNFHAESHDRVLVPILVATHASGCRIDDSGHENDVFDPQCANRSTIHTVISHFVGAIGRQARLEPNTWLNSRYRPTPTIIEAAQALYNNHSVKEITRSDSGAINLAVTSSEISKIIDSSKRDHKKSVCFITGVPGSGKTLAGLNIANQRHDFEKEEHAVFLSGNGPLVSVLREALARNQVMLAKENGEPTTKKRALERAYAFIQNIHHFRDEGLRSDQPPIERVVIFDEAQRAWTQKKTASFMKEKKGIAAFPLSEPAFLIQVMDRHSDWAVIVCLIGGGQEINTGEAGLQEWFRALKSEFSCWDIYVSGELRGSEYDVGPCLDELLPTGRVHTRSDLHLSVSVRSFRSEKVSGFVKALLDLDHEEAKTLLHEIVNEYPIVVTRSLELAKSWLRGAARGTERFGIVASSGGYRLKPSGLHVKAKITPANWFLNPGEDVRSSNRLEDVATEFDIQGLEVDWACVAWDADLRLQNDGWNYKQFRGTTWTNIKGETEQRYLLNAYRVLLTRARQGMVIFVPGGDKADGTRLPAFYDPLFEYLVSLGIRVIE